MRKDRLYILGSLVLVGWLGMTYFIFLHGPKSENRISERAGWKLKKEIEHFEKRLKAQVKDNSLLLQQVQELRDQKELEGEEGEEEPIAAAPIEKQFVDGANEYDAAKVDLNKDAVDAEQSGSAGRNAEELPAEKVAPVVPPGDVMPVLMFACNRVTVTKALDLILKYRTNKEKFPVIVSQVEFDNRSTEVLMLGIIYFCFFFSGLRSPSDPEYSRGIRRRHRVHPAARPLRTRRAPQREEVQRLLQDRPPLRLGTQPDVQCHELRTGHRRGRRPRGQSRFLRVLRGHATHPERG